VAVESDSLSVTTPDGDFSIPAQPATGGMSAWKTGRSISEKRWERQEEAG